MAELNGGDNALRTVTLASIAEYLRCDPQRLRTALRRLTEDPSIVEYGTGEAACIIPAAVLYSLPAAEEVQVLEELMMKPDTRGLPGGDGDGPVVLTHLTPEEWVEGSAAWARLSEADKAAELAKGAASWALLSEADKKAWLEKDAKDFPGAGG